MCHAISSLAAGPCTPRHGQFFQEEKGGGILDVEILEVSQTGMGDQCKDAKNCDRELFRSQVIPGRFT